MEQLNHYFRGNGTIPSHCDIRIVKKDGINFILFEDVADGTSVTNASEQLAREIVSRFQFIPKDCRFFETYRENGYESVDEIEYDWSKQEMFWEAKNPNWKPEDPEIRKLFGL